MEVLPERRAIEPLTDAVVGALRLTTGSVYEVALDAMVFRGPSFAQTRVAELRP